MSYGIHAFFNDECIATTIIYNSGSGQEYVKSYGAADLYYTGFTGSTRFTATAASGCQFTGWTYRLGSVSGTVQTSYSNPFVYTGTQDIWIHADGTESGGGGGSSSGWSVSSQGSISNIASSISRSLSLSSGYVYRYAISFSSSGNATFNTTGSTDTYGYLSTSSTFDSSDGAPSNILVSNDDSSGTNFGFSYAVTSGQTYYLWVRCYSDSGSGSTTVNITPPASSTNITSYTYTNISSEITRSASISSGGVIRIGLTFAKSGSASFYTTGSIDTYGFVGTDSSWNSSSRQPLSFLTSDDDSGDGNNFKISYNVAAGTTYYVWIRCYNASVSGSVTIYIEPPSVSSSIAQWSWTTSNGNASAMKTITSYNACSNSGGTVSDFSYLVWNDMVDKVQEILDATGDSWNTSRATYANTKMSSSSRTLTATKFNSLRYNIGIHYSTGINDVSGGDVVYGWYFTTLANCINGWIDSI